MDPVFIISIVTAITLFVGLILNWQSNRRSTKTEQAQLYFYIAENWTAILQTLYSVRENPPPTLEQLEQKYPTYQSFMATDVWKNEYRVICNFFEDIGLIVYNKNLPLETIQVLVTVSEDDYFLMKPVLDFVRKNYRQDIYHFWNYLLKESTRATPLKPFKGGKAYEPKRRA